MSISDYQFPVSELLNYGDCRQYKEWPNYVQELNLEDKHIPELISMATDEELNQADSDSQEVWSPVHAWRALGQLKADSALEALLGLLNNEDDDWFSSDLPTLCCLIGVKSIPSLQEFLADSSNNFWARAGAAEALEAISLQYPETRETNIATIAQQLEKFRDNNPIFNGLLIGNLIDLQAIEVINLIEQAFKANQVDTFVAGDWEDIQVECGLKSPDEAKQHQFSQQQIKVSQGFASNQLDSTKKKSRKSSRKRKKR